MQIEKVLNSFILKDFYVFLVEEFETRSGIELNRKIIFEITDIIKTDKNIYFNGYMTNYKFVRQELNVDKLEIPLSKKNKETLKKVFEDLKKSLELL